MVFDEISLECLYFQSYLISALRLTFFIVQKLKFLFVLESVVVKQYLAAVSEISKFPIKLYTVPSSVF